MNRLTLQFCLQLVASIVFISFGVVAAFCCAIVDGVFAARHIVSASTPCYCKMHFLRKSLQLKSQHTAVVVSKDLRPLYAGRCEYYSSGTAFDLDVSRQPERSALASEFKGFVTSILGSNLENTSVFQVHCLTASRVSCNLRVKSNTCYCCDLYNCGKYVCEKVPFGYIPPRIPSANKQSEKKKKTTTMLSLFYLG